MQATNSLALVAEDQEFCRSGLSAILRRKLGFSAVVEVRSRDEADHHLRSNNLITLMTVDLALPGMDGVESLRQFRRDHPGVYIAVVTANSSRETILQCLAAGIHGFIPKSFQGIEMTNALAFIMKGQVFVPPLLSIVEPPISVCNGCQPASQSAIRLGLTHRQQEVLDLMTEGRSNKEIARLLDIAPGTVKVHINAAFRTLGVHNRVSAATALLGQS